MSDKGAFEGRVALVTGASAGIGEAITRRLVADGARVIATARREDRLETLAASLEGRVHPLKLDMDDLDAVDGIADLLPEGWRPDMLINNAGLSQGLDRAAKASLTDWDQMIRTNVSGLVHLTRALLPVLIEQPRGDIVNLSSVAGTYPYPGGNVYGATKAFVTQFSLNLRADLLGTNVRVMNVEPGAVETEFSVVRFKGDQARADKVYEGYAPLTAGDIAETVARLLALPPHVNINRVEVMPTQQAFSPFAFDRK